MYHPNIGYNNYYAYIGQVQVMYYKQCSNLKAQSVDDEILILNLEKGNIHQLNTTASLIWAKCDGSHSKEDLVGLLVSYYDIDNSTANNDIVSILEELQRLELIKQV